MRISLFRIVGPCLVLLACGALRAQDDTFTLGFSGPGDLSGGGGCPEEGAGAGGTLVSGSYECTLTHDAPGDEAGAQGWSISVTATNATITSIAIAGTDAEALFSGGFEKSEVTSGDGSIDGCEGVAGAVSAVVLSFTMPIVVPANATSSIAALDVEADIPPDGGQASLQYVDGCRGSGQPVANNITQEGATRAPIFEALDIALLGSPPSFCNDGLNVGFSATSNNSDEIWDNILGVGPDDCVCEARGSLEIQGEAGTVYANLIQQLPEGGTQGWSLSLAFNAESGDISLVDASRDNTVAADAPDGLVQGGFSKTEVVDPDKNNGQAGAVTALVISFTMPLVIPNGTRSVLALALEGDPESAESVVGRLGFRDGLIGSGQAVNNVFTVAGSSAPAGNIGVAELEVALVPVAESIFVRGNANNDRKLDIADAIYTISALFRAGPGFACELSADANTDDVVDLADAVFIVEYLFLNGPSPSAFPECDVVQDPVLECSPDATCF